MEAIACQHCSKKLKRHCKHCLWLECAPCEMLIGPYNVIYYGEAKKRQEESLKRQNGS